MLLRLFLEKIKTEWGNYIPESCCTKGRQLFFAFLYLWKAYSKNVDISKLTVLYINVSCLDFALLWMVMAGKKDAREAAAVYGTHYFQKK